MRSNWKYFLWAAIGIAILTVIELLTPKPVDWRTTYAKDDKIPYGNFILFNELKDIFGDKIDINASFSLYEYLEDEEYDSTNFLFVTNEFSADGESINSLLNFVAHGNNVFIAADNFGNLADTLDIEMKYTLGSFSENVGSKDSIRVKFSNPGISAKKYFLKRADLYYFGEFDTARTVILGKDEHGNVNFIQQSFGEGKIFLHSLPTAFTNYTMMRGNNAEYIATALSYLPKQYTIWDEYYKPYRQLEPQTPLRYILKRDGLRWAYYLTLAGIFLFMIFEAKRKQRVIPVINPLKNSTVEFTETVGRLYHQHANHKNLSEKKIQYFFEYIRANFNEKEISFDEDFYEKISLKSGLDKAEVEKIFSFIQQIENKNSLDEMDLLRLNELMENFKARSVR